MKRLLFLSLLLGLIPSVKADLLCTLTSDEEPDVTISMKNVLASGGGTGTLNYKNTYKIFILLYIANSLVGYF